MDNTSRSTQVGVTQVSAKVFGDNGPREYSFMVDTGSTYLALPREEIEALGLRRGRGVVKLMSATGLVDVETYFADGELMGQEFTAILVPAPTPLLGYELLQNLRFKVDPVTHKIEKVPDDEIHPPFQL
jgi:predicted aspartyl protease